jgi:hypothetical protein
MNIAKELRNSGIDVYRWTVRRALLAGQSYGTAVDDIATA